MKRQITTPEEAKAYRYNRWGGNPKGTAYNAERCCEPVWKPGRGAMQHQCRRKPGFGPHGLYCKQHDPEAVAKRTAELEARHKSKYEKEMAPYRAMEKLPEIEQQLAEAKKLLVELMHMIDCDWCDGRLESGMEGKCSQCWERTADARAFVAKTSP